MAATFIPENTIHTNTTEPTGYLTRTSTFAAPAGVVTATGTDPIYYKGELFSKTNYTFDTASLGNGKWFCYWESDGAGGIKTGVSATSWEFDNTLISAFILYRSVGSDKIGDERHGCKMDVDSHARLHNCDGTVLQGSGLLVTPSSTKLAIADGTFWDDDLPFHITGADPLNVTVSYWTGAYYQRTALQQTYFAATGTVPEYNNAGTATDLTDGYFSLYWIMAAHWGTGEVISVLHTAQYATLFEASAAYFHTDIRAVISANSIGTQELLPLACVIVRNNGGVAEFIEKYDQRYTRGSRRQDLNPESEAHFQDVYIHEMTGNVISNSVKKSLQSIDTMLAEVTYYPSSGAITGWTYTAVTPISVLSVRDVSIAGSISLTETAGSGATYTVTVTGVASFNKVHLSFRYDGGSSHTVTASLVGQGGKADQELAVINGTGLAYNAFHDIVKDITTPADFLNGTTVQIKFVHSANSNVNHRLYVDYVAVLKSSSGSGMSNPMTTAGDIIVGGTGGVPARKGAGLSLLTESRIDSTPSTGATVTLDLSLGRAFKVDVSSLTSSNSITIAFSNVPSGTTYSATTVLVKTGASICPITWPTTGMFTLIASKTNRVIIDTEDNYTTCKYINGGNY